MHDLYSLIELTITGFNPRPAVRPGDAPSMLMFCAAPGLFQSAPGREAGRCEASARASISSRTFQSAPGREAGRCSAVKGANVIPNRVSIRARP